MTTESEPLMIYECPANRRHEYAADGRYVDSPTCGSCASAGAVTSMVPIRVFREHDVRPLWQAAWNGSVDTALAADAFPAPNDWPV